MAVNFTNPTISFPPGPYPQENVAYGADALRKHLKQLEKQERKARKAAKAKRREDKAAAERKRLALAALVRVAEKGRDEAAVEAARTLLGR